MKPACIVHSHRAGLFSLINKVVTCAGQYEHVHVDFSKGPCLYGDPGENVWNDLFQPTELPHGEYEDVPDYTDWSLTAANAGRLYETDPEWRHRHHRHWKRFQVRNHIEGLARIQTDHWNGNHIGVLVRFHGHAREQLTDRSQSLDEYARAFERMAGDATRMHVMAGDNETIKWFAARFPISYVPGVRRTETRDTDQLEYGQQTVEDARMCLREVLILSRCRALIHPVSNMATAALYINPLMESVYLR